MSLVIFWMYLELVKSCKIFLENSTKNFLICRLVCFSLNVSNMEEEKNEWLAQYYSPKSKLFMCGHLAEAHLCTMMMVSDWSKDPSIPQAIHGMFLLSGVFDLVPIVNTYVNNALKLTKESAAQISPQQILIKMSPKFVCPILVVMEVHGSPEFHRQAKEFVEILKIHNVQCSLLELPGVDHFSMIENMVNSDDLLCQEILKVVGNINSARSETGVKGPNSSL